MQYLIFLFADAESRRQVFDFQYILHVEFPRMCFECFYLLMVISASVNCPPLSNTTLEYLAEL